MNKTVTVEQVDPMTREQILAVEAAYNATRLAGETFFAELSMEDRTRFAEVAACYATLQYQEQIKLLREALEDIAKQHLIAEMEDPDGDYEFAYECCVRVARRVLEATNG